MLSDELIREGERVMTICNACRYCEGFCAVFPAMERRMSFAEADMNLLANLCHNCTECIHACQYSPPHIFAVNVPLTLAKIRLRSYEKYCWPPVLGAAFRLRAVETALSIATVLFVLMWVATASAGRTGHPGSFYSVIPHEVMVTAFGSVFILVVAAMTISITRYVRDLGDGPDPGPGGSILNGLRDAFTLKYLHGSGESCTLDESVRTPWRRWFHHFTFYGFVLCFASTCVASLYHIALHREAPYALWSLPVLLGLVGGIGLVVGPIGLWTLRERRNPATVDTDQKGLDRAFILLLVLTSLTGLALLALRDSVAMGPLLLLHLALVLTLFLTLPYGKFVHGLYRTAALIRYARESRAN